jgi:hypothetical protein
MMAAGWTGRLSALNPVPQDELFRKDRVQTGDTEQVAIPKQESVRWRLEQCRYRFTFASETTRSPFSVDEPRLSTLLVFAGSGLPAAEIGASPKTWTLFHHCSCVQ